MEGNHAREHGPVGIAGPVHRSWSLKARRGRWDRRKRTFMDMRSLEATDEELEKLREGGYGMPYLGK